MTMARLRTIVTYLEMTSPPPPAGNLSTTTATALMKVRNIPLAYYRYLQKTVGENWFWWERRALNDEDLAEIVHADNVEIYVLYAEGAPAGFGELNRRIAGEVEIAYFGLVPEWIGRGLGRSLMRSLLDTAWQPVGKTAAPERVWLHTCNLDHPQAIGFYQRAGFTPYRREEVIITDPRDGKLLPLDLPLPPGVDIV